MFSKQAPISYFLTKSNRNFAKYLQSDGVFTQPKCELIPNPFTKFIQKQVIHRDLKPANILIESWEEGILKGKFSYLITNAAKSSYHQSVTLEFPV
jgi:serine/threonine protein kinase